MVVQSGDQQRQCSVLGIFIIGLVLYYIHSCMSEELFISCYYRILAKFVLFEYIKLSRRGQNITRRNKPHQT